jgi:hypothetical protein
MTPKSVLQNINTSPKYFEYYCGFRIQPDPDPEYWQQVHKRRSHKSTEELQWSK